MSHHATNWAIQQRGLKPAAKIVLWHLADCHNPSQGCFPSQEYLAFHCEMSRSTVNLQLEKLEKSGLIKRISARDEKTRKQLPTRYILGCESIQKDGETVSENRTRNEPKTVSEKCEIPCPKNDESRVRKSDSNPVREPVKETLSGENASEEGERENFEDEDLKKEDPKKVEQAFKRFFPSWPTYVSDSEPAARNAWNALEPHEREQAADRMDDYLAAVKASDRKMVCSCARYLSEQRWTKLPPARAKSAQSHPSSFPAFGIGWMALRLWALGQARKPWAPTAMQQKMIDQGVSVDDARHRGEFPLVASMDADSEYGKPVLSSMPFEKLDTDGYVQIKAGSEEWYAWQAWHEKNDYPPLPMPKGKERFVWVPSALPPQGLNETQPAKPESEGSDEYSAL